MPKVPVRKKKVAAKKRAAKKKPPAKKRSVKKAVKRKTVKKRSAKKLVSADNQVQQTIKRLVSAAFAEAVWPYAIAAHGSLLHKYGITGHVTGATVHKAMAEFNEQRKRHAVNFNNRKYEG